MSKPVWKNAPKSAKYLAQDRDGDWYWWDKKPGITGPIPYWMPYPDGSETLALAAPVNTMIEDWKGTLERRP